MIETTNINVSASFDSGAFTGEFLVHKNSTSYNRSDHSIQDYYKLSFKDFKGLKIIIALAVEEYLNTLTKTKSNK